MTNEEMCIHIQQGEKKYISQLWNQIHKLMRMKSKQAYIRYKERCLQCGVELADINQVAYFAFLKAIEVYKPESGNKFTSYIEYPFKIALYELIGLRTSRNKNEPLCNSRSLDAPIDVDDESSTTGEGFTILKGTIAELAADGVGKAIECFKELAFEGTNALNLLQTSTGATAEQMDEYSKVLSNLYANNYGENKIDLAESIAQVKQQLGEIDGEELENTTEKALLLRDTFGFEVNESLRAANMLMKQFEMSADEAYTLIAQGAQNGLNKNDDLLDTINEYSVHYKQMGYTGEEFFNSLVNGAEAGTFSVDKLGDAMKEFGIRTKDTADSTTEGFELIGLDADIMREKFIAGGETAREATEETITALFELDDKVKQNQAGVASITKETVDGLYDTWVQAKLYLEDFDKLCTETLKTRADELQELIISNINLKFVNFQSVFGSLFTPTLAKSNERINQYAKGGYISGSNVGQGNEIVNAYAKGGYISGSSVGKGIVAEAGPELLEIVNGDVKITPLSDNARNTAVGGGGTVVNNYNTFHVQKMDKDTDIYSVSEKLARITSESLRGKGLI